MQGFSLSHPLKINHTVPIYKEHRKLILEAAKDRPSKWMYANVDATHLPISFLEMFKAPLAALNLQNSDKEWKEDKGDKNKPDMPYGKGSIGTHVDEMTGVTMLILLFCEPWVQKRFHPEYNGFNGEFISNGKIIEMKVGDAIVFDDRQPHAWLTNSAWAFATFPLTVQTRL